MKQSTASNILELDSAAREESISSTITSKIALKKFYEEIYDKFTTTLNECPAEGIALEIGSGAGFIKDVIPTITTSDVIPYSDIDLEVDAMNMPFADNELRFVCMLNVLHHIPDVGRFFSELVRCLKPGGKACIVDQNRGIISTPMLKYAHHEPFDSKAKTWSFASTGPLSGANGALAHIVFERDREIFQSQFPELEITRQEPFAPLTYWLAGGLKNWSLLPEQLYASAAALDSLLLKINRNFGSFIEIELTKKNKN